MTLIVAKGLVAYLLGVLVGLAVSEVQRWPDKGR